MFLLHLCRVYCSQLSIEAIDILLLHPSKLQINSSEAYNPQATSWELSCCDRARSSVCTAGLQQLKIAKPYTFCDRGYFHLSSLESLTSLELSHSWMLGAGPESLSFLSSMTLLRKLSITKCFVRDEDLQPIQKLVNLQLLGICETNRISGERQLFCQLHPEIYY